MNERNNIEQQNINYNILNYLRENTNLSPLAWLKVKREQVIAENERKLYMKNEPNDLTEVNYTTAEQVEYKLRLKAFEQSVEKLWLEQGDGLGLSEFAMEIIKQNVKSTHQK